jgi:hypothetical protein
MTYDELIKKVLNGSSVNAKAKELGIPQKTLDQYVKATHLPDCERAILFATAAGVSVEAAVYAIAEKKAELRPERVHSFLRHAMATILIGIFGVNLFLTPQKAEAAPRLAHSLIAQGQDFVLCKIATHVVFVQVLLSEHLEPANRPVCTCYARLSLASVV